MKRILIAATVGCLSANVASAAEILVEDTKNPREKVVTFVGSIEEEDGDILRRMVAEVYAANGRVLGIVIASGGGDVDASSAMSLLVNRQLHLPVYVAGPCLSACAFIALSAGKMLFIGPSGSIGVHQIRFTSDDRPDIAGTRKVAAQLRKRGVPQSVCDKLVATPPADMSELTPAELSSVGATFDTGNW